MNYRDIVTDEQIKETLNKVSNGGIPICPNCNKPSQVLGINDKGQGRKPEAYCAECHLSMPLFTTK